MKFRVGDVVVRKECFQGGWWISHMAKYNLPSNHPLVITEIYQGYDIFFKEPPGPWSPNYFDLVEIAKYKLEDFL